MTDAAGPNPAPDAAGAAWPGAAADGAAGAQAGSVPVGGAPTRGAAAGHGPTSSSPTNPGAASARPPLIRRRRAVVAGVCAGLAEHLGWSVTIVRVWMAVSVLGLGAGALFYVWLWALVPVEADDEHTAPRRTFPAAAILVALAAASGLFAVGQSLIAGLGWAAAVLTVLFAGAALVWSLMFDEGVRARRHNTVVRGLAAALPLLVGAGMLLLTDLHPGPFTTVLGISLLVLGAALAAAPFVVRLWGELMRERSSRIREEQKAEMAAHLHDSVLQTLALIQNRAGASSDVARLARAQERELREWLYAGTDAPSDDLARELRDIAATIEVDYPARIDLVTVGASIPAAGALIAASREAMLNAARHGGGDVSVYVEATDSAVDVYVRDRGPGIDMDALPRDRFGVRESIMGRMQRAGGSATVRRGASGGTEVHLRLDLAGPDRTAPDRAASDRPAPDRSSTDQAMTDPDREHPADGGTP